MLNAVAIAMAFGLGVFFGPLIVFAVWDTIDQLKGGDDGT